MESNTGKLYCSNCPDGGKLQEDENEGQLICINCGIVLESRMLDHGADWNIVDNGVNLTGTDKDKGRATRLNDRFDGEGGTYISGTDGTLGRANAAIRRGDSTEQNKKVKKEKHIHSKISDLIKRMEFPDEDEVIEKCCDIVRSAIRKNKNNMLRDNLIIAALYYALKMSQVPRSISELCKLYELKIKKKIRMLAIGQLVLKLHKEIASAHDIEINIMDRINDTNPDDFLPRFRTQFHLSMNVERSARTLLKHIKSKSHYAPNLVAATALCLAAMHERESIDVDIIADGVKIPNHQLKKSLKESSETINRLQVINGITKDKQRPEVLSNRKRILPAINGSNKYHKQDEGYRDNGKIGSESSTTNENIRITFQETHRKK